MISWVIERREEGVESARNCRILFVSRSFFCQFVKVIGCWGGLSYFSSMGRVPFLLEAWFYRNVCKLPCSQEGSMERDRMRDRERQSSLNFVRFVGVVYRLALNLPFSHLNLDLNMISNECSYIRSLCSIIDSSINEVREESSLHSRAQNIPIDIRINRVKRMKE